MSLSFCAVKNSGVGGERRLWKSLVCFTWILTYVLAEIKPSTAHTGAPAYPLDY